jgi:hypothetical protein
MTLKAFQKCDNKYDWFAYIRIGLYYVMCTGQQTNFCDIHFGWLPGEAIDLGAYSGPKEAVNEITRYDRSRDAVARYRDNPWNVHSDLELSAGGRAKMVYSRKRKTPDVWLFGPLLSEGVPYGSLVAELDGFEFGKSGHKFTDIDKKTGKELAHSDPKSQRFIEVFPKNYGVHFHPCKLFGSSYAEGLRPTALFHDHFIRHFGATIRVTDYESNPAKAPELKEALTSARSQLWQAFLPKDVTRVVWKIEAFASDRTVCQLYAGNG